MFQFACDVERAAALELSVSFEVERTLLRSELGVLERVDGAFLEDKVGALATLDVDDRAAVGLGQVDTCQFEGHLVLTVDEE